MRTVPRMKIRYAERASLEPEELQDLFRSAWAGAAKPGYGNVLARSFTWISAHAEALLVGFVNIAWDGGVHFFMLDTTVHPDYQRRGIGTELVRRAIEACLGHGEWLHVDSDDDLMERLYFRAGFSPANAGTVSVDLARTKPTSARIRGAATWAPRPREPDESDQQHR